MRQAARLLALGLWLAGCGPGPLVRHGALNRPFVDDVATALATFRGLPLRQPVPARVVDRDAMSQLFAGEIDAAFQPGDLPIVEAVDRHLGLLAAGQQLPVLMRQLFERQVAGFYDPRTKTFTVARDAPSAGAVVGIFGWLSGRDLAGELLVAHELTHALQDQYFGIPVEPEPAIDSHGDRLLAQRALFEGDATIAGFGFVFGGRTDDVVLDEVTTSLRGVPDEIAREMPDIPEVLRTPLVFQYEAGTQFAAAALRRGGWAAIDRAQRDPPVSTEQVIHPERYFERRDDPTPIALDGTSALPRAGFRPVLEDTMGELGVRIVLARLGAATANGAADGWDGDRLRAYRRDDAIVSVWLSVWDTGADADEFAAAAQRALPQARIAVHDRTVLSLDTHEAPTLDPTAIARAVWSTSRVGSDPR